MHRCRDSASAGERPAAVLEKIVSVFDRAVSAFLHAVRPWLRGDYPNPSNSHRAEDFWVHVLRSYVGLTSRRIPQAVLRVSPHVTVPSSSLVPSRISRRAKPENRFSRVLICPHWSFAPCPPCICAFATRRNVGTVVHLEVVLEGRGVGAPSIAPLEVVFSQSGAPRTRLRSAEGWLLFSAVVRPLSGAKTRARYS